MRRFHINVVMPDLDASIKFYSATFSTPPGSSFRCAQ
jgi:catechol 2,3-dioxygenase-like lactoylglutathione lyase family enzyme